MKKLLYLSTVLILFSCGLNALFEPELSPQLKTLIAYEYPVNGTCQICTINPDGSDPKVLTSGTKNCFAPVWSPSGTAIAFIADKNLYIYDTASYLEYNITNNQMEPYNISWSPDGKILAFRSKQGGYNEIFTVNVDGSGLKQITSCTHSSNAFPSWSPDGGKIVYVSNRNIFCIDPGGTETTQLTLDEENKWFPKYSPDGLKIYYYSGGDIRVMNHDGSDNTNLTEDLGGGIFFSLSLDGSKIAYAYGYDIWIMDADGSNKTNLTDDIFVNDDPRWSPDGEWIVYTVSTEDPLSSGPSISDEYYSLIAIFKSDGSEKQDLTPKRDSIIMTYGASFSPYIDW